MASPIDHVASHLAHPLGGFNRRTPKRTEAEGGTDGNAQEQTGSEYEDAWPRVRVGSPRRDKRVSKASPDSAHIEALDLHILPCGVNLARVQVGRRVLGRLQLIFAATTNDAATNVACPPQIRVTGAHYPGPRPA